jgi:hypothetical protein
MDSPRTIAASMHWREHTAARGLVSDWDAISDKTDAFARLVLAAQSVLGPGSTIETGVCKGGTSALLVASAPLDAFHVAIDPFGLPTQSYRDRAKYGRWRHVRETIAALGALGKERGVTVLPYVMPSQGFIAGDLLTHETVFRVIHLDGDHSAAAVGLELEYFRRRVAGPALIILDDHDQHFPGVEEGLRCGGAGLVPVLHRNYEFPNYGNAGFSAWLHLRT